MKSTKITWLNKTYGCGDNYTGEAIDGQPDGNGTMVYADGSTFIGQFKDSIPNGHGT